MLGKKKLVAKNILVWSNLLPKRSKQFLLHSSGWKLTDKEAAAAAWCESLQQHSSGGWLIRRIITGSCENGEEVYQTKRRRRTGRSEATLTSAAPPSVALQHLDRPLSSEQLLYVLLVPKLSLGQAYDIRHDQWRLLAKKDPGPGFLECSGFLERLSLVCG